VEKEKTKIYLDYLDKEMTIMGILSTFCVIVSGGAIERITGSDNNYLKGIWANGNSYIILGSVFALLAALFFYLQRSLLAWYFGQISLCIAKGNEKGADKTRKNKIEDEFGINDWYTDADSWPTWIRYNFAFGLLILSFIEYGFGLLSNNTHFNITEHKMVYLFTPALIALPLYSSWALLLLKYPYEDNPVKAFFDKKVNKHKISKDGTTKNYS
jgi:hypothetical protein